MASRWATGVQLAQEEELAGEMPLYNEGDAVLETVCSKVSNWYCPLGFARLRTFGIF